ncbi:hypothetical protein D9M73_239510 [compost metagenome]
MKTKAVSAISAPYASIILRGAVTRRWVRVPYATLIRSKPRLKRSPALRTKRVMRPPESAGACGFSSIAASAGDSVSDSSSEMIVAVEIVTANWR